MIINNFRVNDRVISKTLNKIIPVLGYLGLFPSGFPPSTKPLY